MNKDLLAEIEKVFSRNCRIGDIGFDICLYPDKYKNYENSEKIIMAFKNSDKQKTKYTDEDFEAFKEVYLNTNNIELKASLGYIIGINRYKFSENHQLVKDTIKHLFSVIDNLCLSEKLDNDFHKVGLYTLQAIKLSELFNKKENSIYQQKISWIKCKIVSIHKTLPIVALSLMGILFSKGGEKHFFTNNEDSISEEIFDIIINGIKNLSDEEWKVVFPYCSCAPKHNVFESVYCMKKQIFEKKQNRQKANDCYAELALLLESYADTIKTMDYPDVSTIHMQIEVLQKALKCYEDIGDKKNKNNIKVKIDELNQESLKYFVRREYPVDTEELSNYFKGILKDKNIIESLVYLGFLFENCLSQQFSTEKIEEETIKTNTEHLGINFFPDKKVDNKGNIVNVLRPLNWQNPKEDTELLLQYKYKYIYETLQIEGGLLDIPLNLIKEKFSNIGLEDIDVLVNYNRLIPEDRKEIFKKGLVYGLKGQWLEFLSLMCPQIENFYREIIVLCGGTDNKYNKDFTKQEYFTLGSVLNNEILNEYYEENIILILKAILNEKAGANLRNFVAHGLINDTEANSGISRWLLFFVIMLCYWYNPVAHEIFYELIKKENEIQ